MTSPPPLALTGDEPVDDALALLRATTQGIHEAQDTITALSAERRQLVLDLRERHGVLFSRIAEAADSTEATIYKVHREARDERMRNAHAARDHQWCPDPRACRAAQPEVIEGQLDLDAAEVR